MQLRYLITCAALGFVSTQALAQPYQGDPNGAYCREYTQKVMIGGVRQDSYGTSCQQPDGSWKIVTTNVQAPPQQQVQYVSPPQYVSAPVYVAQPPVYYAQPYPYYDPYPYYGGGTSIGISVGHSWYHDGYHGGGYYGGGRRW